MRTLPIFCCSLVLVGCTANARLDLSEYRPTDPDAARSEPAQPDRPENEFARSAATGSGLSEVNGWEADLEQSSKMKSHDVYVVREGDTLYSVARRHGVPLAMLYSANSLVNDRLTPGQHILIPRQ